MTDTTLTVADLEMAAIIVNAVLLIVFGLVMIFARQINEFGNRLLDGGSMTGFFPVRSPVDATNGVARLF